MSLRKDHIEALKVAQNAYDRPEELEFDKAEDLDTYVFGVSQGIDAAIALSEGKQDNVRATWEEHIGQQLPIENPATRTAALAGALMGAFAVIRLAGPETKEQ